MPLRPQTRSQQEYQAFVQQQLKRHYTDPGRQRVLLNHANLIAKLWLTDISPVYPLVLPRYRKSKRGAPPRDPGDLLRCWLCMSLAGYTSVNDWVVALRTVPLFAILSGFDPVDTPGVGTLYDFQHRLWLGEKVARRRLRRKRRKPRKKVRTGTQSPRDRQAPR